MSVLENLIADAESHAKALEEACRAVADHYAGSDEDSEETWANLAEEARTLNDQIEAEVI